MSGAWLGACEPELQTEPTVQILQIARVSVIIDTAENPEGTQPVVQGLGVGSIRLNLVAG